MTGTLHSKLLPGWSEPAAVFTSLYRNDRYAFWLDAGPGADSGFSYLGAASAGSRFVTASVPDETVSSRIVGKTDAAPPVVRPETIFDFLRRDLAARDLAGPAAADPAAADPAAGFDTGWVGWLGYELGAQTVGAAVHESRFADAALLEIDRMITFDHAAGTVTLLARSHTIDDAESWFAEVRNALETEPVPMHPARPGASAAPIWRHSPEEYAALIGQCLAAIHNGDAYQLCLTNEIRVPGVWQPVDSYLQLRAGSPSHHGGLLRFGDVALLSASPEQFLHVQPGGGLRSKPIKGTRARASDPVEDERLKLELRRSDKERAENLMIVDLMRNDLGRIAELGSVVVSSLLAVESYPHVHQLVSTIDARLPPGVTAVDALESCFPAGSMTGVPKRSAMTILDSLERGARGIYSGAFGYLGRGGAADLAIVIRSIVLDSEGASIGTGGGITALSDPSDEIEETRIKAAALLASLGVAAP